MEADFEGGHDGFLGDGVRRGDAVDARRTGREVGRITFDLKCLRVPRDRIFAFALQGNPSAGREGIVDEKNPTLLGGEHAESVGWFCMKARVVWT